MAWPATEEVRAVDKNENLSAHVVGREAVRIIHVNLDANAGLPGNDGVVEGIAIVLDVTDEMERCRSFSGRSINSRLSRAAVGIQDDGIDLGGCWCQCRSQAQTICSRAE